jgi:hypothetical protein
MSVHVFPPTDEHVNASRLPRKTRYRDTVTRDGMVLISAARHREIDTELLAERLSQRILDKLRLADEGDIALLELLIDGLFWGGTETPNRTAKAAKALRRRSAKHAPEGA